MRKLVKHLLKYMLIGHGIMFSVILVVAACIWFVTLDFPGEMLNFGDGYRKMTLLVLAISVFVGVVRYEARTSEQIQNDDKALIDHLCRENDKLKRVIEANKHVIIQNMTKTQSSSKTTATDIALGVGVGIVGAEIVSNILDL